MGNLVCREEQYPVVDQLVYVESTNTVSDTIHRCNKGKKGQATFRFDMLALH